MSDKKLYDGYQPSLQHKLAQALAYLGTRWVLHPQYTGNHSYRN